MTGSLGNLLSRKFFGHNTKYNMGVIPNRSSATSIFGLKRASKICTADITMESSSSDKDLCKTEKEEKVSRGIFQARRLRRVAANENVESNSNEMKKKKRSTKKRRRRVSPSERVSDPDEGMILLALIRMNEWGAVVRQIAESPQDARLALAVHETSTPSLRLPLHEACRRKAPLPVIRSLLLAYPEALYARDTFYRFLPIHFACRYGAPSDVVEALLCLLPESIKAEDRYGSTPACLAKWGSHENKAAITETIDAFCVSLEAWLQQQRQAKDHDSCYMR